MQDEINEVITGGIEWPTEFDKFISKSPKNADEYVKSQSAWLAKASAYIAMHLKRWVEEKVIGETNYWYKTVSSPFTSRMTPIKQACEDLLNVLPARLPSFQQRFREKYEQIVSVAKKADGQQSHQLSKAINSFKLAARDFHDIVMMIHSESLVAIGISSDGKPDLSLQPVKGVKYWLKMVCKIVTGIIVILGGLWTIIQIHESDTFKQFIASRPKLQSVYDPNAQTDSNATRKSSKPEYDKSNSLHDSNTPPDQ